MSLRDEYSEDARNHLAGITGLSTASFVYDGLGRRMSKNIGGTTTQFLYDGLNPAQELDGGNPASPTANLLTGLGIDEFFLRTDAANGAMSLMTDMLGSTLALPDSSGSIQTQYTYDPFGSATSSGNANANSYRFTGRENDGTGPYFYRARYYSTSTQRFLAQDPIGFSGGDPNLYGYLFNSSTNFRDPLGLCDNDMLCVQEPTPTPTPTCSQTPAPQQSISTQFGNCLLNAGATPLIIAPIVCVGAGVGCLQVGAPGLNVMSCRVAFFGCGTTAAVVAACAAGTALPEF